MSFITARKRSCGKVMFSQMSVILFIGEIAISHALWDRYGTPLPHFHAPVGYPLWDTYPLLVTSGSDTHQTLVVATETETRTVSKRAVCILLKFSLVIVIFLEQDEFVQFQSHRKLSSLLCLLTSPHIRH